jgi:hypothetical protein
LGATQVERIENIVRRQRPQPPSVRRLCFLGLLRRHCSITTVTPQPSSILRTDTVTFRSLFGASADGDENPSLSATPLENPWKIADLLNLKGFSGPPSVHAVGTHAVRISFSPSGQRHLPAEEEGALGCDAGCSTESAQHAQSRTRTPAPLVFPCDPPLVFVQRAKTSWAWLKYARLPVLR